MALKSASGDETMISPWRSFEEFSEWVTPQCVNRGLFHHNTRRSLLHRITDLRENADEMDEAIKDLRELGYDGDHAAPESASKRSDFAPPQSHGICLHICHCGEELLMYSKGLTMTHEAYDFLHAKALLEQWQRYDGSHRIHGEINELLDAAQTLLLGYRRTVDNSDEFLLDQLDVDLPEELERDFVTARDQFSVGLEESAFFSAGRGLEGVLRAVARKKQVTIESRGVSKPASEEDFHDLIECLSRARWKADKTPLIDGRIKSLLHHLRASRNAAAHPSMFPVDENWRALATLVASHAGRLWKLAGRRYAGLVEKKILRVW
jgi:hypothetical protein